LGKIGQAVFDGSERLLTWNAEFERQVSEFTKVALDGCHLEAMLDDWVACRRIPEARGCETIWRERVLRSSIPSNGSFCFHLEDDRFEVQISKLMGGATSLLVTEYADFQNEPSSPVQNDTYFETLFERAPVPIFEEDWSGVKALIDELPPGTTKNVRAYLLENSGLLERMAAEVHLKNANRTGVDTYDGGSKAALIESFDGIQDYLGTEGMQDIFLTMIEGFLAGEKIVTHEGGDVTREGRQIHVKTTSTILPANTPPWGRVLQVLEDITTMKEVEQKLNRAQKMEALGQLTGGIAHDFNNLLAVILGNAELLESVGGSDAEFASEIVRTVKRGADLTHRLLAFSRQQPLKPKPIEICELVAGMLSVLRRTLGETIEIETKTLDGPLVAKADSGQLENAILNLAINARAAMPDGGKLVIACRSAVVEDNDAIDGLDIAAGKYVLLEVSDQGTGMPDEVKERAFEPFFTTKDTGEGSGLGLSMVFGFAQQSGGTATLRSEIGKGTTVSLFLPFTDLKGESPPPPLADEVPRGNGETILVVEDDSEVQKLAETMLRNLGYKVVCASDATAGLQTLETQADIRLVLTDVVLPGGTSGPKMAKKLRSTRPKLKFVYMSGYPQRSAKGNETLAAETVLLNKPFRVAQLAKAVSDALVT